MTKLTQAHAREMFDYDPENGILTRLKIKGPTRVKPGIFQLNVSGTCKYPSMFINGKSYLVHRFIWFWMLGEWPKQLDHKDGNVFNIKWDNFREATTSQNCANQKARRTNKSGLKGVHWHKAAGKWAAAICKNGKSTHIGVFDCPAAASLAYQIEALKAFGEFARA